MWKKSLMPYERRACQTDRRFRPLKVQMSTHHLSHENQLLKIGDTDSVAAILIHF